MPPVVYLPVVVFLLCCGDADPVTHCTKVMPPIPGSALSGVSPAADVCLALLTTSALVSPLPLSLFSLVVSVDPLFGSVQTTSVSPAGKSLSNEPETMSKNSNSFMSFCDLQVGIIYCYKSHKGYYFPLAAAFTNQILMHIYSQLLAMQNVKFVMFEYITYHFASIQLVSYIFFVNCSAILIKVF